MATVIVSVAATIFSWVIRFAQRVAGHPGFLHARVPGQHPEPGPRALRAEGSAGTVTAGRRRRVGCRRHGGSPFLPVRARRRRAVVVGLDGRRGAIAWRRWATSPRSTTRTCARAARRPIKLPALIAAHRAALASSRARAKGPRVPDRQVDGRARRLSRRARGDRSPASSASAIRCSRARRARCATRC